MSKLSKFNRKVTLSTKPLKIHKNLFECYLYYDETSKTGLRWKVDIYVGKTKNRKAISAGQEAGCLNKVSNYYQVRLNRTTYKVHRVIWALHYGECGAEQIDHINGIKTDNKIENLRLVDAFINAKNKIWNSSNFLPYSHISDKLRRVQVALVICGKRITKTFCFSEYGENIALKKAVEYLKQHSEKMIEYGYSERQVQHLKIAIKNYEERKTNENL